MLASLFHVVGSDTWPGYAKVPVLLGKLGLAREQVGPSGKALRE